MKNFISRIECVVKPELYLDRYGRESINITMRCRSNHKEWSMSKIEDIDFLISNFDLIFDTIKENMRDKFLAEVKEN